MDATAFEIILPLAMGLLALGFDRNIARMMRDFSSEFGDLFRERRIWGTLAQPSDSEPAYRSFLTIVRLWGSVMALLAFGLFLTSS